MYSFFTFDKSCYHGDSLDVVIFRDDSSLLSVLQLKELLNYYYPIEIDSSRPVEEKIPLMVEWCVQHCDGDLLSA